MNRRISVKQIIIIESLNPAIFAYLFFLGLIKKCEIFCFSYSKGVSLKICKHLGVKVIDIQHWDLIGFDVPEYFLNELPGLKERINEYSYRLTEKYIPAFFKNNRFLLNNLLRFSRGLKLQTVIKRYFITDIKKKIKFLELSSVVFRHNKDKPVTYLPLDAQWDFLLKDELYKDLYLRVPFLFRLAIRTWGLFKYQAVYVFGILFVLFSTLRRGVVIRHRVIAKELAMPIESGLRNGRQMSDEIFTDTDKLSFKNILFIKQGWPVDKKTEEFLSSQNIDIIEPQKVKVTLKYFLKRILFDFSTGFFITSFLSVFLKRGHFLLLYAIRISKNLLDYEIFLDKYSFKVYLSRDEISLNSNIRTIVFNANGIKVVGFPHGDYNHPFINIVEAYSYIQLDEYFIWGRGYEKYFSITNQDIKKYTPVGIPRIIYIKKSLAENYDFIQELKSKGRNHKVVSVFTGYISQDFLENKPQRLRENSIFLKTILEVYEANKEKYNLYLVIKYKDKVLFDGIADALKDILRPFLKDKPGFAIYGIERNSYNLIAYSDVIVAWGITSTGIEAISVSKPIVCYDPYKSRYNILRSLYGSRIIAWDEFEFSRSLSEVISGRINSQDEMYEYIRREFCNITVGTQSKDPDVLIREAIYKYL